MDGDKSKTTRMNNYDKYHLIIIILALVLTFPVLAFSQADTTSNAVKDKHQGNESPASIHSLYTGVGAGSNMIYLGTSISNDLPFYSASVTYGYRNTLFATASASHLSETNPYLAFYTLALNYSHAFNSWFDISSDIAGYKAAESLQETLFSDFAFVNLTTGFDWKLIYTRLSFGGLISETDGIYLQVSNSRYFETPEFIKGKARISFNPDIDILFGELVMSETTTGTRSYGASPPFRHFMKNPYNSTETYSTKFGLMDFEFSLPVIFSFGNFSIEAEPSYLLPVHSNPDYPSSGGFSIFLNAILKIF